MPIQSKEILNYQTILMSRKFDKKLYSTITDRLLKICEEKNLKPAYLHQNGVAATQTTYDVLKGKQKPGIDFLVKFLKLFPDIDSNWILLGEGQMYKEKYIVNGKTILCDNAFVPKSEFEMAKAHNKEIVEEKEKRIKDLQNQVETLKEVIELIKR